LRQVGQKNGYRKNCAFTLGQRRGRTDFYIEKERSNPYPIAEKLNLSPEDTLGILLHKGLEDVSKNTQGSEIDRNNKEDKPQKVVID
jgi:hypothetical protein